MYLVKPVSNFKKITSHLLRHIMSEFNYILVDHTIEFDKNPYLIGFESKVLYLQHHQLRDYKP